MDMSITNAHLTSRLEIRPQHRAIAIFPSSESAESAQNHPKIMVFLNTEDWRSKFTMMVNPHQWHKPSFAKLVLRNTGFHCVFATAMMLHEQSTMKTKDEKHEDNI